MKGSIPNPEFSSQIKDCLDDPIEKFANYTFTNKDLDQIWKLLEPAIIAMFMDKMSDKKKTRTVRGTVNVPKCTDAKFAGHKTKYLDCVMIICEGDSARGTVHEGIVSKDTTLNYEYFGTFNINGVPMNARKECSMLDDTKNDRQKIIRTMRLQNNERLSSLVKVLGLDYEKTYDTSEEGQKELQTLRYGSVVAAMDQDEDGKGNIFGLLANFFSLFWPALIENRFLRRLNTPIVRLYPKLKKKYVEEFMSLKQMSQWVGTKYNSEEDLLKDYTIKYFKGLGSHKKAEVPHMFKNFDKIIYTYYLDKLGIDKLEVYFGNNTDPRKIELATPVGMEESEGTDIPISEQLMIDTKSYQRDNIIRKLPSLVDGLVPSRRKVLCAARIVFGTSNKEMKVNAFVNETSRRMNYHHGEQSLAVTITKMAQDFPGARSFPYLRPEGQFGTRANGGKDFASPRYTYTKLNSRLCFQMFPAQDDFLLDYVLDDGERCEPKYYIPIIPTALLESMELPATGWKVKIWGRNPFDIINNVRDMISGKITKSKDLSLFMNKNKSKLVEYKKKTYSVGSYTIYEKENKLVITELPLGVFSGSLIGDIDVPNSLSNNEALVRPPFDETNDEEVKITFYFKEGEMQRIKDAYKPKDPNPVIDCWVDFLNLKNSLDENINMVDESQAVVEFKNYTDILDRWFVLRKDLYAKRIDREIILIDLRILYLENIIKFTNLHQTYHINPKVKREDVDLLLFKEKYAKFDHTLLWTPKYTKVEELKSLIISYEKDPKGNNCSYNYIVNLRYSDMIEDACIKRQQELDALRKN